MKDHTTFNKKRYEKGFLRFKTKSEAKKEAKLQRKNGYNIIIDKRKDGWFYWTSENFSRIPKYMKISKQDKINVLTKEIKRLQRVDEHYDYQIMKDPSNKNLYDKKTGNVMKIHELKRKRLRLKRGK